MAKPYHHGDLQDTLLNVGEQALAEMPMHQVSLREIARRAGVSHAAPAHHFPTIGHLFAEIAARGFRRFIAALNAAMDQAEEQTPSQRLFALSWAYLAFADTNPSTYLMMYGPRGPMVMTPNLAEASAEAWQQISAAVAAVGGPQSAAHGALHLWSSAHGLAMLKATKHLPSDLPMALIQEQQIGMQIAGLKAKWT